MLSHSIGRRVFRLPVGLFHARTISTRQPADECEFPAYTGRATHFINNEFVPSVNGATFPTVNPGNGSVLAQVSMGQAEDVDIAVKAAHQSFTKGPWNNTMSGRDRGRCLSKFADLIEQNVFKLAEVESLNNGKTFAQASTQDAPACATILRYYGGWADKITGLHIPTSNSSVCYTRHQPLGVCGLIVPWNLPLIALAAKIGPALCAGNTVVLKTSEITPLSALCVAEFIKQAGFPEGVINIIAGDGATTGAALARHPLVAKISFTGSVPTGKRIQQMAAEHVKRVTLELGGNNPMIVCEDADLSASLQTVHNGLFWNDGEACAAGSRIFVHESIYRRFVEGSVALAQQRRVGNPFHADSRQGAQASEGQLNKVMGFVASAQEEGAKLMCGGSRVGTKGNYMQPTVFADCKDHMKVFKEEVFGPVMTISSFRHTEEVIERANSTEYGLAAGIFTNNIKLGNELMRRVDAGLMFWNCYHCTDISMPFGGFKQSGLGREGGPYGIMPYLEVKNIIQAV